MPVDLSATAEHLRLQKDSLRLENWKRWGPYLSERQWGTVREDYSADGNAWAYFPHEHARSRAYRWGEDGLLGITDRQCRLCFAIALWNGRDSILKERLFGLSGPEGNHGEDVKERYFYIDSTPTHSWSEAVYHYPQKAFPYRELAQQNRARGLLAPEFELEETGIFAEDRYFEVRIQYAKAGPDDLLIRVVITNRGPEASPLDLLGTLWFRNSWVWGCNHEGCTAKPRILGLNSTTVSTWHETLEPFLFEADPCGEDVRWLFTENETNSELLFQTKNPSPYVKDAFHRAVVNGESHAVNPRNRGTKCAAWTHHLIPSGGRIHRDFRLRKEVDSPKPAFGPEFDEMMVLRQREAEEFFRATEPEKLDAGEREIVRQARGGLLWTKQFYHFIVEDWIQGDPAFPAPPAGRGAIRNGDWTHLFARDVLSMPDKWEYPWFAAWDTAFHMIPFSEIDPAFAKAQLELFLREWYMDPNGQLPAYEWNFSDVNPPVHAWAAWRIYKSCGEQGDRRFLESTFQKLLLNFTWWVNRKDPEGMNLFAGGFLGLDNIGVFDRSRPLPGGGILHQTDGTAWMAFYAATMLAIALELAKDNPVYEDMASKFFEHFLQIADAINRLGGTGLWDDGDGFYYDRLKTQSGQIPLKTRSMVGLLPLIAAEILVEEEISRLPGFYQRFQWFVKHRQDLASHITYCRSSRCGYSGRTNRLLALPSRTRLERLLHYLFDEAEFLSPFGIRSLSKFHENHPFMMHIEGKDYSVRYTPGEGDTLLFGGNSNWRGPVWFPINFLLVEALETYHSFYGDAFQVEFPTGSGRFMNLHEAAGQISSRLCSIFQPDTSGKLPCLGHPPILSTSGRPMIPFHEYFHAETGRGLGASHQTGWTALVASLLVERARER